MIYVKAVFIILYCKMLECAWWPGRRRTASAKLIAAMEPHNAIVRAAMTEMDSEDELYEWMNEFRFTGGYPGPGLICNRCSRDITPPDPPDEFDTFTLLQADRAAWKHHRECTA